MIAARLHNTQDLRVDEILDPQIGESNHVKVKILAAGICGSDLHVYETGAYIIRTPMTMGHEFSGQILEIGANIKDFKVGDYVVGDSRVYCDNCEYCLKKEYNNCKNLSFLGESCEGAFADSIVVPGKNLVKISKDVPSHIAAIAEPLAVALHAVDQSTIDGKRILILGAGPVGALIHAVLLKRGAGNLNTTEISEYRRKVMSETRNNTVVTDYPKGKFDLVFETTGSVNVLKNVLPKVLDKGGEAILVGLFAKESLFNFTDIVEQGWKFTGSNCFDKELPMAVQMLEDDYSYFQHIVSHQLAIKNVQAGFDILRAPEKKAMKVVLIP